MGNKLFVGGLSWNTTDESLKDFFSAYGNVEEARVLTDRESGRSKGFGFVTMETDDMAAAAKEQANGMELDGREIRVDFSTDKPKSDRRESPKSNKLFIGGLSWNVDDQMLGESFEKFGAIIEAKVIMDRDSGRSKGFGFVTFESEDVAETAKNEMDGAELDGRAIRIDFAGDKK